MRTNKLLLAAAGLLVAAAALIPVPADPTAPATAEARHKAKTAKRTTVRAEAAAEPRRSELASDPAEAANLAVWQQRLAALEAELGDRDLALRSLLGEIENTYRTWVADELGPVIGLPPAERHDELADIERSVTEGTAEILDQLGLEESHRLAATAGPAEALAAETQYAEAAKDSAARLALLRLDREREARLEKALAIADEAARGTAVAELEAWYDAGLGGIFTPPEP